MAKKEEVVPELEETTPAQEVNPLDPVDPTVDPVGDAPLGEAQEAPVEETPEVPAEESSSNPYPVEESNPEGFVEPVAQPEPEENDDASEALVKANQKFADDQRKDAEDSRSEVKGESEEEYNARIAHVRSTGLFGS